MDQFATRLVGTRSPFGACSCVFDARYISGGSSSGSAVAVALGLVKFSLGTDMAGSGRVPAACNGLIGLTAAEAFQAEYHLREIRRAAESQWARMDFLLLPTTGTIYTHDQVAANPVTLNTNLGYYTNSVNLLDLAAVSLPAGFRAKGLPFGVSVIGPALARKP